MRVVLRHLTQSNSKFWSLKDVMQHLGDSSTLPEPQIDRDLVSRKLIATASMEWGPMSVLPS